MKGNSFASLDAKWQKEWDKAKVFECEVDSKKHKYYVLEMYPYPSGSGLHMGHAFNYTLGDILARYKRMNGFNVLHPMGYDSFGLPAENAAIKDGTHPQKYTDKAIENFIRQQKSLGLSYDWSRKLQSHDPEYYKWNQYIFLQFFKKGLVYRKESPVNWCVKCESVLANEQVHDGKCWRHKDTVVVVEQLEQWFVRTTRYAEELLKDVDKLDWPERIKIMQRNWIGKSNGAEIIFNIDGRQWPVFTTRVDTLFGVTFLVVSAQHPELMEIVNSDYRIDVQKFLKKIKSTKQEDMDKMEKEGVFTGSYAIHPLTRESIPIWVGNFVVADYGSGMVMGVPAHDDRDFAFANKYGLEIKQVIDSGSKKLEKAFTDYGKLINSEAFNGLSSHEAKEHIVVALNEKKLGKKVIQYKLRDWLISRQRYWGTPIPIVYCNDCSLVPVSEKELPVLLPNKVEFGKGNPLLTNAKFVNVKCPKCSGKARRETDTMDTFFDSSWYYMRFTDPSNNKLPVTPDDLSYWMPVDFYTGGAEHACMHLIYARFFTKALRDLGFVRVNEPFPRLFNQGMVHGNDGVVMSKSRGNVIDPLDVTKKYGADTLRLFLVSMASPDKDSSWSDTGLESMHKFVNKIFEFSKTLKFGKSSPKLQHKLNKAVSEISKEIENLNYNIAVIKLRTLFDSFNEEIDRKDFIIFLKLLAPFAPHIVDEIGSKLGEKHFLSLSNWPVADERKIDENIDKVDKMIEGAINDIKNVKNILKIEHPKVYLYAIPNEKNIYEMNKEQMSVASGAIIKAVHAVNDKSKYDPQDKAVKAKPGKPAIYLE
jgi:leucyl-tRNA synthetase